MKRARIFLFFTLALVWSSAARAADPVDVSMIQLLATPERFHGRVVRVQGFLKLEWEGDALYLHRTDFDQAIFRNAVGVTRSSAFVGKELSDGYVLIEGQFDAKETGHLGAFSGSIKNITRAERTVSRAEIEKIIQPQSTK